MHISSFLQQAQIARSQVNFWCCLVNLSRPPKHAILTILPLVIVVCYSYYRGPALKIPQDSPCLRKLRRAVHGDTSKQQGLDTGSASYGRKIHDCTRIRCGKFSIIIKSIYAIDDAQSTGYSRDNRQPKESEENSS